MDKLDRIIIATFLCLMPFCIGLAVVDSFVLFKSFGVFNDLIGIALVTWILCALYLSIKLLVSNYFRSKILTRLTFFRERDEREVLVSCRATRNSYLATLAILIFLLCLSLFKVSAYKTPDSQAVDGKTGMLAIELNSRVLGASEVKPEENVKKVEDYFSYAGLPISNSIVLLFLILWQVFSYNYFVRRIESGKENLSADPL